MRLLFGKVLFAIALLAAASNPGMAAENISANEWRGFYVGANAGWAGNDRDVNIQSIGKNAEIHGNGSVVGGEVGYNFMRYSPWLLGLSMDGIWSNMRDSKLSQVTSQSITDKTDLFATIRARAGYTSGIWLLYITSGYATVRETMTGEGEAPSKFERGWVAGAGVEWKLSKSVSPKMEFLRFTLNDKNFDFPIAPHLINEQTTINIFRLGVDYIF